MKKKIIGYEGEKRKILIVDDEEFNREIIVTLMTPLGFEVLEADDGQAGIEKAMDCRPDLIFMDLMMPELDGLEATLRIRQIPEIKDVRIVALSAAAYDSDRKKSINVGCDDFMSKPVKLKSLRQVIQQQLNLDWIYKEISSAKDTA